LPNSIILSLLIFVSIITAVNFKIIKLQLILVISLTVLYLFLSTLLSAYPRQLYVAIPFLFFWASSIIDKTVIFKFRIIEGH